MTGPVHRRFAGVVAVCNGVNNEDAVLFDFVAVVLVVEKVPGVERTCGITCITCCITCITSRIACCIVACQSAVPCLCARVLQQVKLVMPLKVPAAIAACQSAVPCSQALVLHVLLPTRAKLVNS